MASKRKRNPKRRPAAAMPQPARPQKRSGPSRSELQRAAHERAQRRERLRRVGFAAAVAVSAAAVIAVAVLLDRRGDAQLEAQLTAGSCEVDQQSDPTRPAGQNHVASPSYAVSPPAGGDHAGSAARADVYGEGATPDDGLLVHSLEHGYVVAWHRPDVSEEQLKVLTDFQAEHGDDVIVAERSDLPVPVAATAWGRRLLCQDVDAPTLERFFDEYVGDGPEDVPRG